MESRYLFRGNRLDGVGFIESMTIAKGTIKRKSNLLYMEDENGDWKRVIPETVRQFTGLTDKNGKMIFEGDIIQTQKLFCFHGDLITEHKKIHGLESINGIGSLFIGVVKLDFQRGLMIGKIDDSGYCEPLFNRLQINRPLIDLESLEVIGNIHDKTPTHE